MFIPLENYIQKSAHFMKPGIAEIPFDPWKYIASADGHTYSLLLWQTVFETKLRSRIYVNTAWLKELGLLRQKPRRNLKTCSGLLRTTNLTMTRLNNTPFIDIRTNMSQPRFVVPLAGPFVYIGLITGGSTRSRMERLPRFLSLQNDGRPLPGFVLWLMKA
jgi:hypothetical protein